MGCAASTTAQSPGQQGAPPPIPQQSTARPVAVTQLPQQRPGHQPPANANRGPNVRNAPIIKSLVDLKKEGCTIEKSQEGCYVRLVFSSAVAGEVIVYFNVRESQEASNDAMPELQASKVSRQRFDAGNGQSARLLLSEDMQADLSSFKEAKDAHHIVIELKADLVDPKAITLQRSCLKLNSEHTAAQVAHQKVLCGTTVRKLEAMYGTMPHPKNARSSEASLGGDSEGGECVICLSKPREVAILHCRHVCLCRGCATITSSTWSFQCPVCRGRVAAMVGIEA